ncbi:hypothetical protein Enr13x_60810 [Stieleria neptunia]|uniref:Uncharacterized protein n=1 Tax=Stieleria neptunia TaxID=2527979 RepID=A0A518HZ99_9BACT|nr:DUF58 domain-containing protein [Stieleria neptunia]QDV46172.1 hypothetical protein Enr13x_60810 [Stieleria neptunia]
MSVEVSVDPSAAPSQQRGGQNLGSRERGNRFGVAVGWNWRRVAGRVLQGLARLLTAPIRAYLSLRRSMTVASVSVLLALFMTLNVIWGFPWNGMMGAAVGLLAVGFAINRIMCPRLKLSVSLPRSAVAGHPFSVNVRLTNARMLPALNLRVGWHREGVRDIYPRRSVTAWDASPSVSLDLLRSGDQMQWHGAMRFDGRGLHELPDFQVASTFPFYLFHCRRAMATDTQIAITPAPACDDDDSTTRALLAAIGDWAHQLVAGAPVEYVGNREYEVGVPVRRWDFASWARLGRPIVREYQSPSIQAVTLIVDTSQRPVDDRSASRAQLKQRTREAEEWFERLMSVTATAIAEITSRRVQLNLCLTHEPIVELPTRSLTQPTDGVELMLVRLAAATPVDPLTGQERLGEAIQTLGTQPTLIFSMLDLGDPERVGLAGTLPGHVTYMPIRPPKHEGRGAGSGDTDDR